MGAVKDLVDLVTQLSSSIEDRKFAGELREIQGMIGSIQSEQAESHEKSLALMTENAELKKTINALEDEIHTLKNQETPETSNNSFEKLPEEAEQMLVEFASARDGVISNSVIQKLGLSHAKGEYFYDLLETRNYVEIGSLIMNQGAFIIATAPGREYLVEYDLI